jgi:hypothetical protein
MRAIMKWVAILGLVTVAGCDDNDRNGPEVVATREFWGSIAGSPALANLREETLSDDSKRIDVLVTDGFPNGLAESFSGTVTGTAFELTSVSGNATIEGVLNETNAVEGQLSLPDGSERNFALKTARLGSGRYDIEIDGAGRWTGSSPQGHALEAQAQDDLVTGTVTASDGETFPFQLHDMSRVLAFGSSGGQAGRYTAFVSPRAFSIFGRTNGATDGSFGAGFVNLDLPITPEVLPGVYFGRLRFQSDVLLIDINEPTVAAGPRTVRAYVSDGEPEPDGEVEWFSGEFSGDSFSLTAASGNAQITGTVTTAGVSGTVTYAGGEPLALFAGPAGQGAGVYDVTVDASSRITGTSEEGGSLDFTRTGFVIDGAITTPAGTELEVRIYDLVRALRYPDAELIGTVPDTYVAFVAPRARYIVGRSGDVRGGSAGTNIIQIDNNCVAPTTE